LIQNKIKKKAKIVIGSHIYTHTAVKGKPLPDKSKTLRNTFPYGNGRVVMCPCPSKRLNVTPPAGGAL
jgi:hypothetical protein